VVTEKETDVLIVGAGPTGLVLGLWLTRLGIRVRIIDKTSEPGTSSRALAVQARTLELYRQIGLAAAVVSRGRKMTTINLWKIGHQAAHVVFGEMGKDLSPFPYALIYPQDEHERLLIDRLAPAIEAVCHDRKLPLHVFPWRQEMSHTGLQRDALYLVRPDGYVAFAHPSGGAMAMTDYLDARKLAQTTRSR
jgi:glycine/D-amino acid oxidase-like deaminating enzyme